MDVDNAVHSVFFHGVFGDVFEVVFLGSVVESTFGNSIHAQYIVGMRSVLI